MSFAYTDQPSVPPSIEAMIENQLAHSTNLDRDLELDNADHGRPSSVFAVRTPSKSQSPSKSRSLSETAPALSPSPNFRETLRRGSKDDHAIASEPKTPRRPDFLARGLSLQLPPRDMGVQSPGANYTTRAPLSPQLDRSNTYGTPVTVLPRRSRGLDFARACTNLHHSTLADHSSPDSSPTITQKGIAIPQRKAYGSISMDSPNMGASALWGQADRMGVSGSVGSVNMLGSGSSSSGDDEDDPMEPDDNEEPILSTPHVSKMNNTAINAFGISASPGAWPVSFSPGSTNLMHRQRARLRKERSRKSSSSASGHSSMASPNPGSPPPGKSWENKNGGYFAQGLTRQSTRSRRESLSMVANELHISSGNDSGDEATMPAPSTPGVVRRPVTRRGNLLPKTRAFGRIRAELFEESAPVDSEVRREAETMRQVRESEAPTTSTAQSSPALLPTVPGLDGPLEGIPEDSAMTLDNGAPAGKGLFGAFPLQASRASSVSGREYWDNFDSQSQMPPISFFPRQSSSAMSEDMNMDSPTVSTPSNSVYPTISNETQPSAREPSVSRASTPQPMVPPSAVDGLRKQKRRRDDDFDDINSFKRRAVSPGMSVQNSPILSQSPGQRGEWGAPPKTSREGSVGVGQALSGHAAGERSNSSGSTSTPSLGPKRVGLQGMVDTNDGLMKMSIE
ncbi:hypothetical protein W97_08458 [Coniosporium apollinis CBS 100218]|uniref:Uncharacterized protein n=1 Tax=Coniosporium apollinis (strain CBS 100218) TaxID=1168221 RepID=R7Z5B2_CONA1|nr:uncharacterized protein W97_08458 [Coniosporium apollinis CBS 100218]EON69298.1 hypothetical protein W97_08458 [Coniosporium apollinis CBS 100218]